MPAFLRRRRRRRKVVVALLARHDPKEDDDFTLRARLYVDALDRELDPAVHDGVVLPGSVYLLARAVWEEVDDGGPRAFFLTALPLRAQICAQFFFELRWRLVTFRIPIRSPS